MGSFVASEQALVGVGWVSFAARPPCTNVAPYCASAIT
jgi:hypothetical protein